MRQAVTTMMVVIFVALSPVAPASARGTDAAGTLAQAKRLVEARNYSQAATLLEDRLAEADAKERRSILDLLRRSYEAMAREAKAAGNEREAAHVLDNIAIIDQSRGQASPEAKSREAKPMTPVASPKPPVARPKTSGAATAQANPLRPPTNQSLPASIQDSTPRAPLGLTPAFQPTNEPSLKTTPGSPKQLDLLSLPALDSTGTPRSPAAGRNDLGRSSGGITTSAAPEKPAIIASTSPSLIGSPERSARLGESKPKSASVSLAEGDRLFTAGRYDEAGRCYAALARENGLPAHRQQHWAYCRWFEVVRRINLRPRSAREWDEIEAEISKIQRLTPHMWYGEYLRNKVAEVRRNGRRPLTKSDNLVVRASAPDESQPRPEPESRRFPRFFGKSRSGASAQPAGKPAVASPSGEVPLQLPGGSSEPGSLLALDAGRGNDRAPSSNELGANSLPVEDAAVSRAGRAASGVAWQTYETPNFLVFHQDARLAEAAGNAAEAVRTAQAKRWASPTAQRPWTPRCELYLYPSGKVFARETNQPEISPGFSTMMCNGNRVVARRMNLRADHPLLVTAILPHEVTHVVLADLFTTQQIPRWADEGIAVLAEPKAEQEIRAIELQTPLETGRVFDLRKLMAMDYPDAKDWSLYYAQSVSLTRFLVERGPPEQFVQFVQNSQRDGIEGALRGTYGFAGLADLQERWTEYARQRSVPIKEARRGSGAQPDGSEIK